MSKENILLILWIIFGFIFIKAVDSILYFLIHLLYFGLAEIGISYKIMTYLFPVTTIVIYILTALFLFKKLKSKSNSSGIYLTDFPKKLIIVLSATILVLNPLTNKLSGIYAETGHGPSDIREYLTFIGWFDLGFFFAQVAVLLILIIFSLFKLKELKRLDFNQ